MKALSISALVAMKHLAEYRFLTASRLVRLGGSRTTPKSMSNLLKDLCDNHKLVGKVNFGVHPKNGKLETVYFLTPKAAKLLASLRDMDGQRIKYPKSSGSLFHRDYFHRLACLDFEISFKKWLKEQGFKCLKFERYFDFKANRRAETELILNNGTRIVPDAVAHYQTHNRSFLFLLEVSLGRDAKRVIEQLYAHIQVLEEGIASQAFNIDHGHFIVCVFEYESCMKAVMRHMNQDKGLHSSLVVHFIFTLQSHKQIPFETVISHLWNGDIQKFYFS